MASKPRPKNPRSRFYMLILVFITKLTKIHFKHIKISELFLLLPSECSRQLIFLSLQGLRLTPRPSERRLAYTARARASSCLPRPMMACASSKVKELLTSFFAFIYISAVLRLCQRRRHATFHELSPVESNSGPY